MSQPQGVKRCLAVATVALAAILMMVPAGATFAAGGGSAGLVASLDAAVPEIGAHDDITLRFTLRNTSAREIAIPYWQTPERGIFHDIFDVRLNGKPVEYVGRDYKWATPEERDIVRIPAGAAISSVVELSSTYAFQETGAYTVRYRASTQDLALRAQGPRAIELVSNEVSLFIERDEAAIEIDFDEIVGTGSTSVGRYLSPSFVSCSSSRQTTLRSALGAAETMASKSRTYLNAGTVNSGYTTWFGTYTASRYNTVKSHFANIYTALNARTVTFYCDCTDSAYAYVFKNQPYRIHLCNAFWSAPLTGTDSKGGTIVHETSHFTVVADTDDWAYGQTACRSLATSNPTRAVDNADSHEYFAESRP